MLKIQQQFLVSGFLLFLAGHLQPGNFCAVLWQYQPVNYSAESPALQLSHIAMEEPILPSLANSWRRRRAVPAFGVTLSIPTLWMHYLNLLCQVSARERAKKIGGLLKKMLGLNGNRREGVLQLSHSSKT